MTPFQRPVLSICVALGVMFLMSLGTWQVKRLAWKEALIEAVEEKTSSAPIAVQDTQFLSDQAGAEYTNVLLRGQWESGQSVHVSGTWDGKPGFYVFSSFRLAEAPTSDTDRVLINRGFIPFEDKNADHYYDVPEGIVELTGILRQFASADDMAAKFAPPMDEASATLYRRTQDGFAQFFDGDLLPMYVESTSQELSGSTIKSGTFRAEFSNKHLGYAITWFGLAAGLVGTYFVMLKQGRRP